MYAQSLALDGRTEHPTKLGAHINRHALSKVCYIWERLHIFRKYSGVYTYLGYMVAFTYI